jgi:hypothetical protein
MRSSSGAKRLELTHAQHALLFLLPPRRFIKIADRIPAMAKTGPRGSKGEHDEHGERGERGERGRTGRRGARGERGPSGPGTSRAEILAAVEDQLAEIRKQLDVQLTRFGQLHARVDHIQTLLKLVVQESR